MDRSFLDASIPEIINKLSLNEKIELLSGKDWWRLVVDSRSTGSADLSRTQSIPRLGIPR
jgi:hypothetical protein